MGHPVYHRQCMLCGENAWFAGYLMVIDGSAGNAVDLVSLDTNESVPSCLQNLTDSVQLYGGCLTSLGAGMVAIHCYAEKPQQ